MIKNYTTHDGNGPAQELNRFLWVWSKAFEGLEEYGDNLPLWWPQWTRFCGHSWLELNHKIINRGWTQ